MADPRIRGTRGEILPRPSRWAMAMLLCATAAGGGPGGWSNAIAGPRDAPAIRFLPDLSGQRAGPGEIVGHTFLCRLSVAIAPQATVAQLNAALARVNGTLATATNRSPFLVVQVPCAGSVAEVNALSDDLDEMPGVILATPAHEPAVD